MRYLSTRGRAPAATFREALLAGLAADGGLFMPERLPELPVERWRGATLSEAGEAIAAAFIGDEIPRAALGQLLHDALTFPVPLVPVEAGTWALELFHGPTLAFKDVGARVMARLMAYFHDAREPLTVLVATSGDTGSAVAQAFHGLAGTRVVVLYPDGQVSAVQEAQFTTLGGNVTAVAVRGTFDDCQRLAKQAFADEALRRQVRLTSANSINIGRLLPQMFYYVHAALALGADAPAVVSVPSGNFGNLTAGLMARAIGAPVAQFIAATTINDTVPRYLATGRYEPKPSQTTLANSMDVGDPSNVERMRWLMKDDVNVLRGLVSASVHTDADVRLAIRDLHQRTGYVCDPHSAIAYLGCRAGTPGTRTRPRVFLATAHPAKFGDVVAEAIGTSVPLPPALAEALSRPRHVERIPVTQAALRELL